MDTLKNVDLITSDNKRKLIQFLLIVVVTFPSLIWIICDNSPWLWDQAYYAESALLLHRKILSAKSLLDIFNFFIHSTPSQAPGLVWLSQLFISSKLHFIETILLIINWGIVAISLFLFVELMEAIKLSRIYIILGAICLASSPLIIGISHQYLVEPMQMLTVIYALWVMVKIPIKKSGQILLHFLFLLFLCLSSKVSTFIYIYAPFFIILKSLIKNNKQIFRENSKLDWGLLITLLLAGLLILGWYFTNYQFFINHVVNATINKKTAILFGQDDTFLNQIIYWLTAMKVAMFIDKGEYVFLVLLSWLFISKYTLTNKQANAFFDVKILLVKISILQILTYLVIASLQINKETRFLMPVIPYIAILINYFSLKISDKLVKNILIPFFILQLILVNFQSFKTAIDYKFSKQPWILKLHSNPEEKKFLAGIINKTCSNELNNSNIILGADAYNLNTAVLSFYMAKKFLNESFNCSYSSGGFNLASSESDFKKLESENAIYFVTFNEDRIKYENFYYPSEKIFNYITTHWKTDLVEKNNFYMIYKIKK